MSMELHLQLLAAKCPPELAGAICAQMDVLQAELNAADSRATEYVNALAYLRAELTEARRLLDDARVTLIGIAGATARAWELPRNEFIDEFLPWAQSRARDTAAKIAAPVPAQPAAILAPTIEQTNRNLESAGASFRVQPARDTSGDVLEITNAIILDVCETDPADPSHPETVCINVDDLRETVERHILAANGDEQ